MTTMKLPSLALSALVLALAVPAAAQTKPATKPIPKVDPSKVEPAKAEPPKAEPPKTEPAKADVVPGTEDDTTAKHSAVEPPPVDAWDINDVAEKPGKTYLFLGLRYRGNVVPKFLINTFVDEGKTIWSNSIAVQLDIRKDNFSLIPALQYTEYGTGDILFKQKNTNDFVGNYTLVNSGLKAMYLTADLLWSTPINKNFAFEYGAGFGLGFMFGDLVNNWVKEDPNGEISSDSGRKFTRCQAVGPVGSGCNKVDHQNSDVDKVGNYTEKTWAGGGSVPNVFPWIAFPQIGARFKPIKNFVGRANLGFSLTGFWFGLSAEYGLEQKPKP
jgi:hypothetical protein